MKNIQYTAGDRTPYTYIIRFPALDLLYYGAQWRRKCHPENLGKTYFSSSPKVKHLLQHHEAIFEPRKTFTTIESCQKFETRFLQKVDARRNQRFINRHNNENSGVMDNRGSKNPMYGLPGTMLGKRGWNKGLTKHTDTRIAKQSKSCSIAQKGRQWKVEQFALLKGEKHLRFEGWFHTPWGRFSTTREAVNHGLQHTNIRDICKVNPDSKVSNRTKNAYLKQFNGKSFREIGFWFEPIST